MIIIKVHPKVSIISLKKIETNLLRCKIQEICLNTDHDTLRQTLCWRGTSEHIIETSTICSQSPFLTENTPEEFCLVVAYSRKDKQSHDYLKIYK